MSAVVRHYLLAAGGTGGHLLPAFALASELLARGHKVALVTDARGARIPGVPDGVDVHLLPAGRMDGSFMDRLRALNAIRTGRRLALSLLRQYRPSTVVGFGGYPALPALLAAQTARVPYVIHEQNAVIGRVNRLLAARSYAVATAYGKVDRMPAAARAKVRQVGNPVREPVLALRDQPFPPYRGGGSLRLLVTGGSQGARVLSQVVPAGLAMLPLAVRAQLHVTQQCRPEDIDEVRAQYARHDISADLATYFENMAQRLADAHLFIGRAGASTIAELTAVGRPSILIPLPIATNDHQTANARELVEAGGAVAMAQRDFTAAALARQVEAFARDGSALAHAAHQAWNCGQPDAAKDLADLVESTGGAPLMDVIRLQQQDAVAIGIRRGVRA
ncbi:undecaprenyldiphospho-muramoylpentapeptide beta-N-acetylglucosaminyltransferase [Croceicoccus sp. F390]|uniref:UDP-N-acetylglucosamine--N-acetylmuramyl-(pentapeptide) pyrophosphoryl-undecaprenol N-acetylglucosamine transferase n=1 Tax=Croceicoccus esteveae TaxID=3075597 RepID=A0ABU2ZGD2_9SPHN|nr:undecaprenyldiphospho-muramoylpentapeptide beta-N-acetylglucosaminyltransferase [Croceicoccus sp. F390]MDT0575652.1 undecaprenyldiphospho-muramoylpentapeptide beta-N-acetylglucosaminyltransferase [Croceicoccus sp. F390]